jgi:uncharacterized protein YbcI
MTKSLEAEISEAIAGFHRDQQGHSPGTVEAHIVGTLIVVRSHEVFTPTERGLVTSSEGQKLVQSARRDQRALTRRDIEGKLSGIVGRRILRSFYDIDIRNGEQVEVYVLEHPL